MPSVFPQRRLTYWDGGLQEMIALETMLRAPHPIERILGREHAREACQTPSSPQ
ncbi:hypothetical protein [Stenotrophomonas maltophilia]|uniref:hypothetical protein n=1 Tax=Stenotrophomonas maltophilia TaxID=40324 RepID=UPI0013046585|nr:hypothetical protein [Stenotrophomonas maltophilia]